MAQGKTPSSPLPNDGDSFSISYDISNFCDNNSFGTLAVLNSSVTILGLVCSLLLIVTICKNYALRGDKYMLLNNVLLASLLLLIVSGFMYVEKALNPCWAAGDFVCKVIHFFKTILTNTSTFFLIALSVQQLNRYRQQLVTIFNSTHVRCMIVTGALWSAAVILSLPEFLMAKVLYYVEGDWSMCDVYHGHHRQRFTSSAKILFFEYISPFLTLLVVIVITGVYVAVVKSRYTQWGVTTGESLVPRDDDHPKHFSLVVTLSLIYLIGYFPLYSFELATFLEAIMKTQKLRLFWWHMDTISTFFALLPPALTPLVIMLLSCKHLDILKSIYGHLTVIDVESPQSDDAGNSNDAKIEQSTTNEQEAVTQ